MSAQPRLPIHYRDDDPNHGRSGGLCPWSGTVGLICPFGCAGAREHYANDGHPECEEG